MKVSKYLKKTISLSLVLVTALSLAACGSSNETATSGGEQQTEQKQEEKKEKDKTEFAQNEVAVFKDVNYTITKVEKSAGGEFEKPKEGKEYVVVTIKIDNKSQEKISYNPFDWKMENGNGQEEDCTFTTIDGDTSLESGDLKPGGTVEGSIVFEEPIGDTALKMNYYDNSLFDENPTFQFKIN